MPAKVSFKSDHTIGMVYDHYFKVLNFKELETDTWSVRPLTNFSFSQQVLYKACDGSASDGNVFDAGPDDVALGHGDDVSDAVPGIDHDPGQGPLPDLSPGPGGRQTEDGLDCDVEAGHVETLEHDLGCVLPVLGRVEGRLRQQEVVILRLRTEIFKNAVL